MDVRLSIYTMYRSTQYIQYTVYTVYTVQIIYSTQYIQSLMLLGLMRVITSTKTSLAYEQDAVSMLSYANISNENAKYEVPRYKAVRVINQAVSPPKSQTNSLFCVGYDKLKVNDDLRDP